MDLHKCEIKRKYGGSGNFCAVKFCGSNSNSEKISLFRFPKDPERCKRWIINCHCENLKIMYRELYSSMYRVCSKHFEQRYFVHGVKKRRRLKQDAIPTLNLLLNRTSSYLMDHSYCTRIRDVSQTSSSKPLCEPSQMQPFLSVESRPLLPEESQFLPSEERQPLLFEELQPDSSRTSGFKSKNLSDHIPTSAAVSTQTSKLLSSHTPQMEKLRKKIRTLQARCLYYKNKLNECSKTKETPNIMATATIKDLKSLCDKYFPSTFANFVKLQADLQNKKNRNRRYSKEFLQVCLKIYSMSPNVYESLSGLFILPSKKTLSRMRAAFKLQLSSVNK